MRSRLVSPTLQFLFLLASFICLIVATFGVRARWAARINLIALGLALFVLVFLLQALFVIA
jgi:hypothetical protein